MGTGNFDVISSEIKAQLGQLERVLAKLLERDAQFASGEPVVFEGAAYHVHNYYSAAEDLLKIVAAAFENNIDDASRWHSELIDRMTLEIEGVDLDFSAAKQHLCCIDCAASATSSAMPIESSWMAQKFRPTSNAFSRFIHCCYRTPQHFWPLSSKPE